MHDILTFFFDFSTEREPRERQGAVVERDISAGPVALPASQRPPWRPQGIQGQLIRVAELNLDNQIFNLLYL